MLRAAEDAQTRAASSAGWRRQRDRSWLICWGTSSTWAWRSRSIGRLPEAHGHDTARSAWAEAIDEAVREHDAWGLLRTRPDGDVTLYDVVTPGSYWAATGRGGRSHLVLAREARRRG